MVHFNLQFGIHFVLDCEISKSDEVLVWSSV